MDSAKPSKKSDKASDKAVITLTMDAMESEPREVVQAQPDFQPPCTFAGLTAGVSGGTLGYVFGFAGYWMQNRLKGQFKESLASGWTSAKTFAVMGGLYAGVSCFMKRLRQKEDAWNGAASGCATGLALGWSNGPLSALQSCAMLGAFSFFVDGMAGGQAANAAEITSTSGSSSRSREYNDAYAFIQPGTAGNTSNDNKKQGMKRKNLIDQLLTPALAVPGLVCLLAPCSSACTALSKNSDSSFLNENFNTCRVLRKQ